MKKTIVTLLVFLIGLQATGQVGISVSPPRLYFELNPGVSGTNKVKVTNVSSKNSLDLAITLGDWEYDEKGENLMFEPGKLPTSCASWISVGQGNYFSLKPGESKEINITLTTPRSLDTKHPVHTSLLYITQMNPNNEVNDQGADIKVNVRSAVKIYHRVQKSKTQKIDIQNLAYNKESKTLDLLFNNLGNSWADGSIFLELLNNQTGKQIKLQPTVFYTLPGNKRIVHLDLPKDLPKGRYTATVLIDYDDQNNIEAAELNFTHD